MNADTGNVALLKKERKKGTCRARQRDDPICSRESKWRKRLAELLTSGSGCFMSYLEFLFSLKWFKCVSFACNPTFPDISLYLLKKLSFYISPVNSDQVV